MKKEFAVLVDHKSEFSKNENYRPVMIEANDILDAMDAAEKFMDETVYLIKILERKTGVEKFGGYKRVQFEEILVNRGHGWKKADVQHYENASTWNRDTSTIKSFGWTEWSIAFTKWS